MRSLIFKLLDMFGVNVICRYIFRNKAIILIFHGICDDSFDLLKNYDDRQLPLSIFQKQLNYLNTKGYHFLTMTELIEMHTKREYVKKCVVLTFDDGYRNVVRNAYPIMKKLSARGCVYLISDLIGTNNLMWSEYLETLIRSQKPGEFKFTFQGEVISYLLTDRKSYESAMTDIKYKLRSIPDRERKEHMKQFDEMPLINVPAEFHFSDWKDFTKLDPQILEIGCHTKSHPNCANLETDLELYREIVDSKEAIEKKIGRTVNHFCYPAGSYNTEVISKVISAGYQSAVTTDYGFNHPDSNAFTFKRIEASASFSLFKANISGTYDIIRTIKTRIFGN